MDDQDQRMREAYRNAASNRLAFGFESEGPARDDPATDRISAALAILSARGYPATDPVLMVMPADMADMFDWANDPSVVQLPLGADDPDLNA